MIHYWNPYTKKEETENVYGEKLIQLLYDTLPGQKAATLLAWPTLSKFYGLYQSSFLSRKKIDLFIKNFQIPMHEFEEGPYKSFNDFFIRKFLPGVRPFVEKANQMPAFAEGRYLAYERLAENHHFPVKGKYLRAVDLLGSREKAIPFKEGPIVIARLCPTDYHRFHFPDDGKVLDRWKVAGQLHSVNPVALDFKNDIFITNERQVTLLETKNFGRLAFIEVGALCVGKIVETHKDMVFKRGDEKGYFLFGGSSVIVLGESGAWLPRQDLLKNSSRGLETYLHLGDKIATST